MKRHGVVRLLCLAISSLPIPDKASRSTARWRFSGEIHTFWLRRELLARQVVSGFFMQPLARSLGSCLEGHAADSPWSNCWL